MRVEGRRLLRARDVADGSNQPASKSIVISVEPARAAGC